ncbi:MAG: hypothetical protein ACOVJ6_05385 [Pirellulales bacterium]|jgi:hypothetical protein
MSETLSEFDGCDLLARLFRARGYAIKRNQIFREYGVEFHIDGWDPQARVGFEFLTSEDEDHDDLTLEEYKTLCDAQRRGDLALFIIDEVEPLSEKDLAAEAHEFLDEMASAAKARVTRAVRTKAKAKAKAKAGRPKAAATKLAKQVVSRVSKKSAQKSAKKVSKKAVKKAKPKRRGR